MGSVYLAEQISIGRKVALKVLQGNYSNDDEFIGRFRREARLAASLNHRNIVTVYDFDQGNDGSLYIAMEYLQGSRLSDVVRRDGPLEIGRAVRLGLQIAEGLEAAHLAGVIHRDIKPDNIMVLGSPGAEEIKLMDFGIARMMDSGNTANLTRTGMIMGTPAYMAPEQAEGATISERTDIYALGVVLYEMLTGSVPFKASTPSAVLIKHLQEQPARLRKIRREVPPLIERLVMQALEKKPEKRVKNMHAVVEELQEANGTTSDESSATQTILQRVIRHREGFPKEFRYKLPLVWAAVAVVVVLGFALSWFFGSFRPGSPAPGMVVALALKGTQEVTVGQTGALTVIGKFSDGAQTAIDDNLEWQSSDPSVVTVSGKGEVLARNEGVAQISVKHMGVESAALNVTAKAKALPAGPTVDELIRTARSSREQGNYDGAFDALRQAKAADPRNKMVHAEYQHTKSACQAELRSKLTSSRCDS
jgi:serine/threonine-protein kinase